jgi:hypothetical protein
MSEQIEDIIEVIARRVYTEMRGQEKPVTAADVLDEQTLGKIRSFTLISHKPYLTKKEAALYLDVSERSIAEWSARPEKNNPLPCRNAGGEPRFRREDLDAWAERERQRQRLKLAS